jgi:signal transduction histidine kinase
MVTLPPEGPDAATLALAHALRTPLTSLVLGLGLLDDGALGPLSEAQREVVRALVSDVARLARLVEGELQTDRLGLYAGPIELVPTDLGALVERAAVPIVAQAREHGVEIARSLAAGVTAVLDPVKLRWVIASVLGNALRFSPAGGVIEVGLTAASGEAELRIVDHGPGVSPEVRPRLFDRSGGPGLFLAREIVEAHGGSIDASSEPGQGCVFTIRLPLGDPSERGPRDEQEG